MNLPKFLSGSLVAAVIVLGGCKQEQAPLAVGPPQVVVATVEQRDVPIMGEWIGRLDGSANVDVRARVQGYIQTMQTRFHSAALSRSPVS